MVRPATNRLDVVLAFALILAVLFFASPVALSTFSQRMEGIDVQIYKVVYDDHEAVLGTPTTYVHGSWRLKVPSNYDITIEFLKAKHPTEKCYRGGVECTVVYEEKDPTDIEVRLSITPIKGLSGRGQVASDYPIEGKKTIEWEIREGNKVIKRRAVIVTADTWVEIRTIPNTGFDSVEGVFIWFVMRGISWQTFVEEPEAPEGYKLQDVKGVFIPVLAYIKEAYDWAWIDSKDKSIKTYPPDPGATDKVAIHPSGAGDVLTLYHEPSEEFQWPWEVDPNTYPERLKSWLAHWSPDWTLRDRVYFKLYIRRLQPHVVCTLPNPFGGCLIIDRAYYPSTVIRIRTVALAVGEFTYVLTEQEAEKLGYSWEAKGSTEQEFSDISDWFDNAWAWLNSPQGMFTMFLVLIGLIVFLLAWSGVLPVIVYTILGKR